MNDKEFRTGVMDNGERLMQPSCKLEELHQRGVAHLIEQVKSCHFECEAGPLENNVGWQGIVKELETPFDYVAEASLTLSPQWHGDKIANKVFIQSINEAIHALQKLDNIKKTLFYGRDNNIAPNDGAASIQDLPERLVDGSSAKGVLSRQDAEIAIHAIVGIATEAGELLEALRSAYNNVAPLDLINLEEEVGDAKWYMAILAKVCGFAWGDDERRNIRKLRARFPDRFTAYDANNRNLAVERAILEEREAEEIERANAEAIEIMQDTFSDSDGDDGA